MCSKFGGLKVSAHQLVGDAPSERINVGLSRHNLTSVGQYLMVTCILAIRGEERPTPRYKPTHRSSTGGPPLGIPPVFALVSMLIPRNTSASTPPTVGASVSMQRGGGSFHAATAALTSKGPGAARRLIVDCDTAYDRAMSACASPLASLSMASWRWCGVSD
jgi:hypothetical protein